MLPYIFPIPTSHVRWWKRQHTIGPGVATGCAIDTPEGDEVWRPKWGEVHAVKWWRTGTNWLVVWNIFYIWIIFHILGMSLFFHILGISSSQLTNSYFSEGSITNQLIIGEATEGQQKTGDLVIRLMNQLYKICDDPWSSDEPVDGMTQRQMFQRFVKMEVSWNGGTP